MCILLSLCWETSFHSCARPKRQTDCTCSFFFSSSIIATNQPSLVSLLFSFSSTSLSFLSSSFSRNKSLYLVIYSYSCRFYFFLLFIINLSHLSLLFCFCSSVLFRRALLPSLSLFLAFFLTLFCILLFFSSSYFSLISSIKFHSFSHPTAFFLSSSICNESLSHLVSLTSSSSRLNRTTTRLHRRSVSTSHRQSNLYVRLFEGWLRTPPHPKPGPRSNHHHPCRPHPFHL